MKEYRRRPQVIRAMQLTQDTLYKVCEETKGMVVARAYNHTTAYPIKIEGMGFEIWATYGDWLILNSSRGMHVVSDDQFNTMYEENTT